MTGRQTRRRLQRHPCMTPPSGAGLVDKGFIGDLTPLMLCNGLTNKELELIRWAHEREDALPEEHALFEWLLDKFGEKT